MFVRSSKQINESTRPDDNRPLDSNYICHALGCTWSRLPGQLMCQKHWFELSLELRHQVEDTYACWVAGSQNFYSYRAARLAAIIYVGKLHHEDVSDLEIKLAHVNCIQQ
jgi:hypothetical protein